MYHCKQSIISNINQAKGRYVLPRYSTDFAGLKGLVLPGRDRATAAKQTTGSTDNFDSLPPPPPAGVFEPCR